MIELFYVKSATIAQSIWLQVEAIQELFVDINFNEIIRQTTCND